MSRVPGQTKAAVVRIVAQTKERSKWPVYRTLDALGVPRSVYLRLGRSGEPGGPGWQALPGVRSAARGACGDL